MSSILNFQDVTYTPTAKLLSRLSCILSTTPVILSSKYIVLIQTGAYNPTHLTHLRVFYRARKYIEANFSNHHVLAGYISPSHDIYVSEKLGKEAIFAYHRIAMAQLTTAESDWVDVDTWEAMGVDDFVSFPNVAAKLRKRLRDANWHSLGIAPEQIEVWYLAGADLLIRAGVHSLLRHQIQPIFMFRAEPNLYETVDDFLIHARKIRRLSITNESSVIFVDERDGNLELDNLSSTEVRKRLARGLSIDGMVAPEVNRYLRENRLLQGI